MLGGWSFVPFSLVLLLASRRSLWTAIDVQGSPGRPGTDPVFAVTGGKSQMRLFNFNLKGMCFQQFC